MIDDKCQKMMGRGVEGGCGTEEKPCTVSRVSAEQTSSRGEVEISFYEQARKALTERSPFDSEEVNVSRVTTLPAALADSLSKYTNTSRKRQKKSGHADSQTQQVRGSNIWVETEDYFRPLTFKDIDVLCDKSTFGPLATQSYFMIPPFKTSFEENVASVPTVSSTGPRADAGVIEPEQGGSAHRPVVVKEENQEHVAVKEENNGHLMEIDGAEANVINVLTSQEAGDSYLPSKQPEHSFASMPISPARSSVLEWLLGSRNKILLTSERPSKKRKHLGSDAGLDRLRIVCPSEGQGSPICHVCCLGDLGEHSNQLVVCNSCKVTVHQKCYGVQEFPVGLWLCSWCKYCRETGTELFKTPCFLCPKSGGALKPLAKDPAERKPSVSIRFVHLFCSQWMPEVYVEDTTTMEPIMNVGAIKETRKKLVCNICKVKHGACVRCSHGTCRTSFHPICAREARNRMEIWGKTSTETVELRAFCSKHSEFQDNAASQTNAHPSVPVGCDASASKTMPVKFLVNKSHKLKLGHKNGDQSMVLVPTSDTISNKSGNSEVSSEQDTSVPISNTRSESECHDAQSSVSVETPDNIDRDKTTDGISNGCTDQSDSLDFIQVLKKLVDRGKVSLKDVALEIGISTNSLAAALAGDRASFFPNLHGKIAEWLDDHPDIALSRASGRNGLPAVEIGRGDNSKAVPIKTIPLRKPISNRRIMKDNKVRCSLDPADGQVKGSAVGMDEVNVNSLVPDGDTRGCDNVKRSPNLDRGSSLLDDKEMVSSQPLRYEDLGSSIEQSVRPEAELANGSLCQNGRANATDDSVPVGFTNSNGEHPVSSAEVVTPVVPNPLGAESPSCSYVHPFIQKRLMHLQNVVFHNQENANLNFDGLNERDGSNINSFHSPCIDPDHTSSDSKFEQLAEAKKMGILDISPEDEVEGELIYFQNKLMENAVKSKRYYDELIFRVIKALPHELEAERKQRWDSVLVNQYISGVREAKKQGRKERRHKEAQAVLAAATAAAAASSRISSFRKDSHDEVALQEATAVVGRTTSYSQMIPRAKETLSRLAIPRVSSEKPSDIFQLKSFLNEHQQICDICRRSETMLNPIFVCCHCKVAVHFGCYRGVRDHTGPWYCELCEELLPFRSPRPLPVHSREKSAVAVQCGLCGGTTGAFRKSIDGQWVHSFCAEWLLESTFRRGQPNPVEGMETILKGREFCCICSRKVGVCIKCNYGNCQSIFHPACARNAGFYMHVKTSGGKLLHKAYCDKHSLEQRRKAEAQQHGPEELKAVKQIRVELERVRLLCERIIKREKVKRELVICSHNIFASKRDSVAFSVLVRSPFFLPDVSSESATTSLRGHVDDNKSCSEAMQRSEDVTADSAVSGRRRDMFPVSMDIDQKTDDSSTSQHLDIRSPSKRPLFSGKQLPLRPASHASRNATDEEERRLKSKKHIETFQKELVMTSDQASVQNQRLPKGFAYVPIVCLPKEKPALCERGSPESVEPDG